jgi:hypothetical protein
MYDAYSTHPCCIQPREEEGLDYIDLYPDFSQCHMNCKPKIINTLYTKLNNITSFTKWDNFVNSVFYLDLSLSLGCKCHS